MLAGGSLPGGWTEPLCHAMARLETEERQDKAAAELWSTRARWAVPGERWVCDLCAGEAAQWEPTCPHCQALGSLSWHTATAEAGAHSAAGALAHPVPALDDPLAEKLSASP